MAAKNAKMSEEEEEEEQEEQEEQESYSYRRGYLTWNLFLDQDCYFDTLIT